MRRQRGFEIVQFIQQLAAALVIGFAIERGSHLPRRALQQLHAQMTFELLNQQADRGPWQAKIIGRLAKTAQFNDAPEHLHGL